MSEVAGIYVHIPFCERKCTYCNFNTTDFDRPLARSYIKAVAREMNYWGDHLARRLLETDGVGARVRVDSIYFGGGTPSIVEADQLADLIAACRNSFDVSPGAEVTIEINPSTLSRERMADWLAAGINRASVGVQSFIDRELLALSRTHSAADARRTLDTLGEAGFGNVSLDLIAGLPEQTEADWRYNLREAFKAEPEHLSLYLLEVKEGTQLFSQIKRGLRPAPDDDLAANMYGMICDAARSAGYDHYEISNFARLPALPSPQTGALQRNSFRSIHNMKYWTGAPFYGMGCGAHSYDGRSRWVNTLKTEGYVDLVNSGGCAISQRRELSDQERAAEGLFMRLRLTEGVDLDEFRAAYGLDVAARYSADLDRLGEAGLIDLENGRLRLTQRGLLLSNEVFVAFI